MSRYGISELTYSLGKSLIQDLGLSHTVKGASFIKKDFLTYVTAEVNPSVMTREEYLISELFSKFPFKLGYNLKSRAIGSFLAVEENLGAAEVMLRHLLSSGYMHEEFHWVFHSMKQKIARCLGDFNWSLAEIYFGFGPGASFDIKRSVSQLPNKYGKEKPSVTMGCLDLAVAAVCSHSLWYDFHRSVSGQDPSQWFTIVEGNKVVTVPKNAKTERTIAVEPTMNMYIQKGIGGLIRRRLHKVGVNLQDQSINQTLALKGSLTGSLATLDLKAASDGVSWFLCQELLPPDWVSAIKLCRSPTGILPDGSSHYYRKVSSMGNGFTFELESLIFWALIESCCDYLGLHGATISVYGDDLIIPTEAVSLTLDILRCLGFEPNMSKSFWSGEFRESCGEHYSHGSNVSPFYIRKNIEDPHDHILVANLLREWASANLPWGCDKRCERTWNRVLDSVPSRYRCFGPLYRNGQLNDSSFGVDWDFASPSKARNGYEGWQFHYVAQVSKPRRIDHIGALIGSLDVRSGVRPPKETTRYNSPGVRLKVKTSTERQWHDSGPWLVTTV